MLAFQVVDVMSTQMLCDCPVQLQTALGPELSQSELLPMLHKLLRDNEAEVRTAAVRALPGTLNLSVMLLTCG